MRTIRHDIERERELRKVRKPLGEFVPQGLTAKRKSSGSSIVYCGKCGAPVVDSARAREAHAQRKPECREAIEDK